MTSPLALVWYEQLMPGSQLVNRLQDLGYRVLTAGDSRTLQTQALAERPLLIMVDLATTRADPCAVISELRKHNEVRHVPVIAFGDPSNTVQAAAATRAGATLVAGRSAIVEQIPQLLEQALMVE